MLLKVSPFGASSINLHTRTIIECSVAFTNYNNYNSIDLETPPTFE